MSQAEDDGGSEHNRPEQKALDEAHTYAILERQEAWHTFENKVFATEVNALVFI